ncbi:MAG: VCBS repeat-containing protein [Myxococcales bacterium]|nr:VCBS repeat-containing protein [Myxococcales bacterium]
MRRALVVAALVASTRLAGATPFAPPPAPAGGGPIGALWRQAVVALEDASAARVPVLVPPTPRPVTWKARRVASLDLGAPVLALAAADLDGDRIDELIVLTERHVVVLAAHRKGLRERARIAVPADPPALRPRDPIGALAVAAGPDGVELWARSSSAARAARYGWRGGALVELAPVLGYPLCADRVVELAAGRNYATVDGVDVWTARCRLGEVDRLGRSIAVEAMVAVGGAMTVTVDTRCPRGGGPCAAQTRATLDGVGTAVEVADVDRDGAVEVLVAGAGAPGDADAVAVHTLTAAGFAKKPRFRRAFLGGVVGLAVGDVDGDGDREAFAAVRLAGARKVDLWLLD